MKDKRKRPFKKEKKSHKVTKLSKAKVKRRRSVGNQAAYEKLLSEELCDDLARKFGRRTGYGLIAKQFVCLRSVADHEEPTRSFQ
jgi:hypothetical protein